MVKQIVDGGVDGNNVYEITFDDGGTMVVEVAPGDVVDLGDVDLGIVGTVDVITDDSDEIIDVVTRDEAAEPYILLPTVLQLLITVEQVDLITIGDCLLTMLSDHQLLQLRQVSRSCQRFVDLHWGGRYHRFRRQHNLPRASANPFIDPVSIHL